MKSRDRSMFPYHAAGRDGGPLHQAAAVGERPLAEHVQVAGLVHDLRDEEHARLEVVGGGVGDPPAGNVGGHKLDLGEERGELALRALDVIGKRLDRIPGDVRRRAPLALQRLLVEHGGVGQPDVGLGGHRVAAYAERAGSRCGAPRLAGVVVAAVRRVAVGAFLDVGQREAPAPRLGLDSPLAAGVHPAEVQVVVVGVALYGLQRLVVGRHMRPPSRGSRPGTVLKL